MRSAALRLACLARFIAIWHCPKKLEVIFLPYATLKLFLVPCLSNFNTDNTYKICETSLQNVFNSRKLLWLSYCRFATERYTKDLIIIPTATIADRMAKLICNWGPASQEDMNFPTIIPARAPEQNGIATTQFKLPVIELNRTPANDTNAMTVNEVAMTD
ncbi:hypothetical protein NTGM5_40022 [Candidatus Nitrotoga sp. M5]|nr:hypothetical protein NTGM5_40022 [Candidatus Nitrotoga sp. M5]